MMIDLSWDIKQNIKIEIGNVKNEQIQQSWHAGIDICRILT